MEQFRELAETEIQCSVCSEVLMDATAINCGHTFCKYCIVKWKRQKPNCPVCRKAIFFSSALKMIDQFIDKMYQRFVSETGQAARTHLREERRNEQLDDGTLDEMDDRFLRRYMLASSGYFASRVRRQERRN